MMSARRTRTGSRSVAEVSRNAATRSASNRSAARTRSGSSQWAAMRPTAACVSSPVPLGGAMKANFSRW